MLDETFAARDAQTTLAVNTINDFAALFSGDVDVSAKVQSATMKLFAEAIGLLKVCTRSRIFITADEVSRLGFRSKCWRGHYAISIGDRNSDMSPCKSA